MPRTTCSKCDAPLNTSHHSYCRDCLAIYARQNRANRGDQAREYSRAYRKQWMEDHPEKRAEYARKALYNLTPEQFTELLAAQDNLCAICSVELVEGRGSDKLAVDHNHDTGHVRGLLCQRCNLIIGQAQDSTDLLLAAVEYLRGSVVE